MQYLIVFLEGIITFISPCLLPMLPIYVSYFAGSEAQDTQKTLLHAFGFVLGFTLVFMALGALAGTLGSFLTAYQNVVNLVCGLIVIFFGLHFLGVFQLNLFRGSRKAIRTRNLGFFSAMVLGFIFSLGWTPCVGAFLGSALMLASQQGHVLSGMLMLLIYSLGLGLPFLISAVLIDRLKSAFDWIKSHYAIIQLFSGSFLILVGVLMATGLLGRLLTLLSYTEEVFLKQHKTIWIILLLAALLLGASVLYTQLAPSSGALAPTSAPESDSATPEPIAAPDFTAYDLDGNAVQLSDFAGSPIVLNFWASWCGPCKSEMGVFQKAYDTWGDEVQFVMVNMTGGRETLESASAYVTEQGFTFPVLYDTDADAAVTYGVRTLPTTYFIDADGFLIAQGRSALDEETLHAGIDMILS